MKDNRMNRGRVLAAARIVAERHNQALAGLLAIQIILSVVVFWPTSSSTSAGGLLFSDVEPGNVVALTITDAEGNSVALRKVGGTWVLPDADDYPADSSKVDTLLEKLLSLTTGRLVTRTDASHQRLQVAPDDFVRRVDFEDESGAAHTLYLGSSPQYGATHFRQQGRSETYLSNELSSWDVGSGAAAWVDTLYLSVAQADVTSVTLENGNGTFVFTKEGADAEDGGQWVMAGLGADETHDESAVDGLVGRAASVYLTQPLGTEVQPSYGMDRPSAAVTLETPEKVVTLRVGAQDPADNSYVVKSSESAFYVRVAQYSVQDLTERTREDFLLVPPTPTPEPDANSS